MIPRDTATGLQSGTEPRGPDACYGMTCPVRGQCARYEALGCNDGWVILHCRRGDDWPLFAPRKCGRVIYGGGQ